MNSSSIKVPFSPGLTLVAYVRNFKGSSLSATGIAQSRALANRLADSEMQERATECSTPQPSEFVGVAAGTSYRTAAARAQTELLERLAVHQWWYKGAMLRRPLPSDQQALHRALLLYRRNSPRSISVAELAIAPPYTIFVVWSHDKVGQGLCLGFGASPHRHAAIYKALRELVQMEFSLGLIFAKLRSNTKLGCREQGVLDRAIGLRLDTFPELWSLHKFSTVLSACKSKLTRLRNPIGDKVVVRATFLGDDKKDVEHRESRQWGPY